MTKNFTAKTFAVATAAAMALSSFALPLAASAAINSTKINIVTTNRGTIDNTTSARSHTGDNTAEGSVGGDGGNGGDVTSAGSENNGGASAGNGGNGGAGGAGGLVDTGDATAEAGTENDLNTTDAEVRLDCELCDEINSVTIDVITDNDDLGNNIDNTTRARARTGDNTAEGSVGGDAGNGGDVNGGSGNENNGGADSGNGGAGGAGSLGGEIRTGAATSKSGTVNMLNTSLLRVRL